MPVPREPRTGTWLAPSGAAAFAGVSLGGEEGVGHFITVLDHTGEGYVIADPLRGRLVLSPDEARRRYHFTGFFMLVPG